MSKTRQRPSNRPGPTRSTVQRGASARPSGARVRRASATTAPTPKRSTLRWLLPVLVVLLIAAAALLLRLRGGGALGRGPAVPVALPDTPSGAERTLVDAAASARADDPAPGRRLGEFYLGAGRPFEAVWAYAGAVQARPADRVTNLGLARALEAALFHDAAIERLRAVLAREPGQPEAVQELADLYLRTGRPEAALTVAKSAAPAFLGTRDGEVLEGRVRQALGDAPGAEAAYRRAMALDEQDAGVRHRIGLMALSRGEIFQAQQAFAAARIIGPPNPRYDVDLGRAFAASPKREEWRRAPEFYVAAMNRNLRYGPAHYEAGLWYLRQSRWQEAIERLQMAVQADPNDARAHEGFAQALKAVGRKAEALREGGLAYSARSLRMAALREYQAWAALDRASPDAELQVAQTYFETNHVDTAKRRLEKARLRFPRNTELRDRLVAFYFIDWDRARARRLCQEWQQDEPNSPQVHWLLGRAAANDQQYAEAVRLHEQALAKEPVNALWLGTLGETLLKVPGTDAVPRAVEALSRAAAGAPEESRWRLALAQALLRLGRFEDARRQTLRALDLDPHQNRAYSLIVQLARQERAAGPLSLYAGLVRTVEARLRDESARWGATWRRPHDPIAFMELARFLIGTGELSAAEGQLAEALRLRPGWPEARARWATVRRLREVL